MFTFIHARATPLFLLLFLFQICTVGNAQIMESSGITDPEPLIEVPDDALVDSRIEKRIDSIFDKIEGLDQLEVEVDAGVVVLTGDVSNENMARDALEIATRTAGVVTVTDDINRTLDVVDNVKPMVEDFKSAVQSGIRALPLFLLGLSIVVAFVVLAAFIASWKVLWQRIAPNPFLAELLAQAVRIVVILVGAVLALNLVGASKFVATILGGAGVLGIAIGFAVRDTLENYISSIMLSLRQPFRAQDHVVINEHEGFVVRLTSRATILMTLDGNHLRIPNSFVFKGIILNYTTNPERRFDFKLGIGGNDDPLLAMQVGLDAINNNKFVLKDPGVGAVIDDIGDSSIVILFTGWVDQSRSDFGKARSVAMVAVKTALEDSGFTLPETIYRLRFDGSPPDAAVTGQSAAVVSPGAGNSKKIDIEPSPDVSVDHDLQAKVNEERAKDSITDLLDHEQPVE